MGPLSGIRVIDFTTLLPGPLATLMLAEAGAEVIKIERPGGDEMRRAEIWPGDAGTTFALLNRGKRSVEIDLKASTGRPALMALIESADVLVEQFRPGVMARFGLDHATLSARNPGLVYCSITGYGQCGPNAQKAGHDLNYLAETGLLHLTAVAGDRPLPPEVLIADIAGGTYPAVMNILLALRERDRTGKGCHLDTSMSDNLLPLAFAAFGQGLATGRWSQPGQGLFTGGSPRYQLYRTADDRLVAVAALEERFWERFCEMIELQPELRDDTRDAHATRDAVAAILRAGSAEHWRNRFAGHDVCCSVVDSLEYALGQGRFSTRVGSAEEVVAGAGSAVPVLPVAVDPRYLHPGPAACPALGEANEAFGFGSPR